MTLAYVLLLDLVGSSRLPDRQAATETLQSAQSVVNERFTDHWLAPLETTRGDEMAAVLRGPEVAYDVISDLGDASHPLTLRAVVKHGELVAGLETRRASIIDGPAFHVADRQMDDLKDGSGLCRFDLGVEDLDRLLNALGNLLLSQLAELTELQRQILRRYQRDLEANGSVKQEDVARALGTTQQSVSKTLKTIRWELIDAGETEMRRLLAEAATRRPEGRAA